MKMKMGGKAKMQMGGMMDNMDMYKMGGMKKKKDAMPKKKMKMGGKLVPSKSNVSDELGSYKRVAGKNVSGKKVKIKGAAMKMDGKMKMGGKCKNGC